MVIEPIVKMTAPLRPDVGPARPIRPLHPGPARFEGGLREVGRGVHAWLQPNGLLGESNAGLVIGDGASLLVDTL
jgi:hypothetical protein